MGLETGVRACSSVCVCVCVCVCSFLRFSFQKMWMTAALYLTCQAIFSLLAFICVVLHLLETPYLSSLKSTLTTEQT